ncbi:hypothetical protein [uncultured Pseudokineococcus sp.]|uniref:5'-methylthioadenosine/S-adenosylhomocysteine nucleosidase family protein n=1 Tax=uncultured Pseudokineococcus sp. TaxID=1642928 RepID=UPI0026360875|nr:hypothetical protein [uncultured Pseudokineococcus sp.]
MGHDAQVQDPLDEGTPGPTAAFEGGVPVGSLLGSTHKHARFVVFTITDKEFPEARTVLERFGKLEEVGETGVYAPEPFTHSSYLPFALAQSNNLTNHGAGVSLQRIIRQFRPQHVIVVGTAGGVQRPTAPTRPFTFQGPERGDVVVSSYVHYADYGKSTPEGFLMRYIASEQPAYHLLEHASNVKKADTWRAHLGPSWANARDAPKVHIEDVLAGDTIQDDPLGEQQQLLMRHFDKVAAIEMESAGVARTLHTLRSSVHYGPTFVTIRGISDIVYGRHVAAPLNRRDIRRLTRGRKDKTTERALWSPRAAAAATAFAVAVMERVLTQAQPTQAGHPAIPAYTFDTVDYYSNGTVPR